MKLSPWMNVPGYEWCAMRVIKDSDPEDVANRYAFIEKTPRVRIKPFDYIAPLYDYRNWKEGPKGSDECGNDENSRAWCDKQLLAMGFELE